MIKLNSKFFFIFLSILILLYISSINVYPGWFKHFGGANYEDAISIQQTSDGGYIVAGFGYSVSHGNSDFALYKLTSSGTKSWFRHYGGAEVEVAESVQQTSDGGYIVAGVTKSYTHGNEDFAIYKLDSNGNKIWFKHYGGTDDDWGYSIQQTSDGGYIVAGATYSFSYGNGDFALYKLDSNGNKIWFKHYGGTDDEYAHSVQQTSDGGYIMVGHSDSFSHGNNDIAVYKLTSSGTKTWFKHYGGTDYDSGSDVQQTSDGGYIITGSTKSFSYGSNDFAVYKLNSAGNKIWFKHYGGINNEIGRSVQQTSDGGYVMAGWTDSYTHGNEDFSIYRLNSSGNKVWFKHYGGSDQERGASIQQTSDGGYIVAGFSYSYSYGLKDFAIYKLESNGNK